MKQLSNRMVASLLVATLVVVVIGTVLNISLLYTSGSASSSITTAATTQVNDDTYRYEHVDVTITSKNGHVDEVYEDVNIVLKKP
jgi:archaellum component FlaF (FlaF/FlaG flagellin family)